MGAQLACARIGAVHSVVFAGFSAESLSGRILDSRPRVVLTTSAVKRGAKPISLKARPSCRAQQQGTVLEADAQYMPGTVHGKRRNLFTKVSRYVPGTVHVLICKKAVEHPWCRT